MSENENQLRRVAIFAAMGLKLGRQIHETLLKIDDSIELIAAEIARQLGKKE